MNYNKKLIRDKRKRNSKFYRKCEGCDGDVNIRFNLCPTCVHKSKSLFVKISNTKFIE